MLLKASGSAERVEMSSDGPSGTMVEAFRLAAKALGEMQRHRVCPTAQAYELWLAYCADTIPALTRRVNELLQRGEAVTPETIEALRTEFDISGGSTAEATPGDHLTDVSDNLQRAAVSLVEQATESRGALRNYGEVLAQSFVQLGEDPNSVEGMRIIGMLSTETLKMAEHNRDLREQLASTSGRVDKLRRLLADEKQAACTDKLTGLANRRAFDARLKRALSRSAADGGPAASLLMLDIDHFKRFNDSYGHSTGDLVLRLVGRLLTDSIKGRDIAARYGGEEFAVLLMGADLKAAAIVARQICSTLANKRLKLGNATEQGQGRVTISIGVAQLRLGDTLESAVERADAALYAAKRAGRNRVMVEQEIVSA